MPPKLKRLSGKDVVAILSKFDFEVVAQRGSHAKLRRQGPVGEKQTLLVPLHDELDTGTVLAIFRQASRYINQKEIRRYFYTE